MFDKSTTPASSSRSFVSGNDGIECNEDSSCPSNSLEFNYHCSIASRKLRASKASCNQHPSSTRRVRTAACPVLVLRQETAYISDAPAACRSPRISHPQFVRKFNEFRWRVRSRIDGRREGGAGGTGLGGAKIDATFEIYSRVLRGPKRESSAGRNRKLAPRAQLYRRIRNSI